MCTFICGSASLAFKGTVTVKWLVLIKLMLTLNGLNVSASCVKEEAGKKDLELITGKIKSQKLKTRQEKELQVTFGRKAGAI